MSRHVVPAIVLVTLTIMFGSSFWAQRRSVQLRQNAKADARVVQGSDAPVAAPQAVPPE